LGGGASGPGRCKAGHGALPDQLFLELSKRAEDVEDQPSARGRRVERLDEADKSNAAFLEVADNVDEMPKTAPKTIQTPTPRAVAWSGALQRTHETRSLLNGPRGTVHEDAVHTGPLKGVEPECFVLPAVEMRG
jgi:hypothetical protein